jgi:beta-lactamase superfamily II metal-dependent hydrolase
MATTKTTVSVRMYNVGFGDAFVVTVRRTRQLWRMIVDCGVHAHGRARPLEQSVQAIIDDLRPSDPTRSPHVNVVVATHHHADHIAGFALDAWQDVAVDEVWVPFVEDSQDDDAKALREAQTDAANHLLALLEQRTLGLDPGAWPATLTAAHWFAINSSGNAQATDRLLGRNGRGFATTPTIRYLPAKEPAAKIIPTTIKDVSVRVLGPPRDPEFLKHMNPPAQASWLTLGKDDDPIAHRDEPLFAAAYTMSAGDCTRDFPQLAAAHHSLKHLDEIDDAGLLAAAAILERSVNNTSVFFVLDVAGLPLVFPGDAQQGAWDHVLADPDGKSLIANAAFYKISHHGSGNGTPRDYVESILKDGAYAMLPWGLVKRWQATIPKPELLDALTLHHHHVIRADHPIAEPGHVEVHNDMWSQVTFTA